MRIYKWSVDVNETELTNYVWNKIKKEENESIFWVIGVFFMMVFGVPMLITIIVEQLNDRKLEGVVEVIVVLLLIIILLSVGQLNSSFKALFFYKILKNKGLAEVVKYLYDKNKDSEYVTLCYILLCKNFKYAYVTENKWLVVVYNDTVGVGIFELYDYEALCDSDDEYATLTVTRHGIKLISYDGVDTRVRDNNANTY